MKILGLKDKNITILTAKEIERRGVNKYNQLKITPNSELYYFRSKKDYLLEKLATLQKLRAEPLPYSLFRLNELSDFSLNYVGCEITEEEYFDRLEQLPPIPFKYDIYEGYIVNECITANRFEHIFEHDNKFFPFQQTIDFACKFLKSAIRILTAFFIEIFFE